MSDDAVEEYVNEGLAIGRTMVDQMLVPILGESPDAWFGAGVMAQSVFDMLQEVDHFDEDEARRAILAIAVLARVVREHPLALAALAKKTAQR